MHLLAEKVLSLEKTLGGVLVKITVNQMVGSMMIIISQDFPHNKLIITSSIPIFRIENIKNP